LTQHEIFDRAQAAKHTPTIFEKSWSMPVLCVKLLAICLACSLEPVRKTGPSKMMVSPVLGWIGLRHIHLGARNTHFYRDL
jgi:hypothetical protein